MIEFWNAIEQVAFLRKKRLKSNVKEWLDPKKCMRMNVNEEENIEYL
jgi:hypothetical protein